MKLPNWDELRAHGYMVVDGPQRKLAVYPNYAGQVVMAYQEGADVTTCLRIGVHEMQALMSAMANANDQAVEVACELHAAEVTQDVLERVKGWA